MRSQQIKPAPQLQSKPPARLEQRLRPERFLPQAVAGAHSFTSPQVSASVPVPDSRKPVPQAQPKPPEESVHTLEADRFCPHVVGVAHSSMLTHVAEKPLPERTKPAPQLHV